MVLTDLPFERNKLLHSRYELIHRPGSAPPPAETDTASEAGRESKDYAAFLRAQERKVGPEGFLDSTRYSHTFQMKNQKETKSAPERSRTRASTDTAATPPVVSMTARVERDEKDYRKRIKVVEDHMWQHKQEERELKRVEGDIIKNQRAVRHTLRDFGHVINKKRITEEKKLNQSMERFTDMQREHVHKKQEIGAHRAHQNVLTAQMDKAQCRKVDLQVNDLAKQYQQKMSDLDLKRVEVMRMSQDYETKMRAKEEEQHRLKKELAELSITLNMVAQKGRVQQFDHDRAQKKETTARTQDDLESDRNQDSRTQRTDGEAKMAEISKRKSVDLAVAKAHLKREENRNYLAEAQMRLEENSTAQRQTNEATRFSEMDHKARQLEQRLEAHNVKKISRLQSRVQTKKDKDDAQQAVWEARFKARVLEADRKKHEDSLKFFSKVVSRDEEKEQALFGAVREAEYARQKKDQEVKRLQQRLLTIRAQNKMKLKQEQLKVNQTETELEQAIIREKVELDKVHALREDTYIKLQAHRHKIIEDKHLQQDHEREYQRLYKTGPRSENMADM